MPSTDFKSIALLAAKEAGKVLQQYYGKTESVKVKSNKSLVGIADTEADKAIISVIKKNFPNHSILSEESGFDDNNSDYKWAIDPVDGTHNFLRGIPFCGVSIALEYKNEIILGVLYFPFLEITAIAEKGKGAFMNGKRIKVSDKKDLGHAFILVEFSYSNRKEKVSFLDKFVHETIDVRNFGCAIYHLLLVACGSSEGYVILSTNEWDVAAGFIIVQEAGGKITDLQGKNWNFTQSRYIVSNSHVHEEILKYLK